MREEIFSNCAGDEVGLGLGLGLALGLGLTDAVALGLGETVAVALGLGLGLEVGLGLTDAVADGLGETVAVGVGLGVGDGGRSLSVIVTVAVAGDPIAASLDESVALKASSPSMALSSVIGTVTV